MAEIICLRTSTDIETDERGENYITVLTRESCFHHCRLEVAPIDTVTTAESFDPLMNADCTLSHWS